MSQRQLKVGYFVLEGLNAFATTYFFSYLFFFTQTRFGFGNARNLWLSALNGFVYIFAAWFGGRLAQRLGYFFALRLGFSIMAVTLGLGSQMTLPSACYFMIIFWTLGVCFIWPSLEALASENETPAGLQQMVGIYNIVWAGGSALAYFMGGAVLKTLGMQSLFWLPAGVHLSQLLLVHWLKHQSTVSEPILDKPASPGSWQAGAVNRDLALRGTASSPLPSPPEEARGCAAGSSEDSLSPGMAARPRGLSMSPQAFLRMAWIANPFAYMAINTALAMMPDLAARFKLSLSMAGIFCSTWFLSRLLAFTVLWLWPGWHYRFRWLASAYGLTMLSFLMMLLAPHLWMAVLAQVFFGIGVGLIYYSSLYYSMEAGDAKGEHGGVHEAAIGLGIFTGPAVGAASLYLFPQCAQSGPWAVTGLLLLGGALMLGVKATQPASHH